MTDASTSSNYFYLSDGLGSIIQIQDSNRDIVEQYTYDSFGNPTIKDSTGTTIPQSAIGNPYMFTSREWDPETNLYYYRTRYYDAGMGRFLSEDPAGYIDGMNLYEYVINNPINYIDPYGLWKWYGCWGGPDWTGGQTDPYEELTEEEKKKLKDPTDSMDECYMAHDKCCSKCRVERDQSKCRNTDEEEIAEENFAKCWKKCNQDLYHCLKGLDKDPNKWPKPAPDPKKARKARKWAQRCFLWL